MSIISRKPKPKPVAKFKWLLVINDNFLFLIFLTLFMASFLKSMHQHEFASWLEALIGGDKNLHVIAGFFTTLLIYRMFDRLFEFSKAYFRLIVTIASSIIIFSLEEFLQSYNAARVSSWPDWFASLKGIGAPIIFIVIIKITTRLTKIR